MPIETYIKMRLDPQLRILGLNDRQRAIVGKDIRQRLTSLVSRWHDPLFRRTILFTGVEEAWFYEPLTASLDIRALIVVVVRNSLLEDLGTTRSSHPGLGLSRPVLRDAQMPMITREAAEHFQGVDLDAIESLLPRMVGPDVFGGLPVKYPHAWYALSHLSNPFSIEMILEPVNAPPLNLPFPSHPRRKAASETIVESGIDPAFDPAMVSILEAIKEGELQIFFTDSFKGITRNPEKLYCVIDFVLGHKAAVVTHNYTSSVGEGCESSGRSTHRL